MISDNKARLEYPMLPAACPIQDYFGESRKVNIIAYARSRTPSLVRSRSRISRVNYGGTAS